MIYDKKLITAVAQDLGKTFSLQTQEIQIHSGNQGYDEVRQILSGRIAEFIDKDFERLMQIFYRLDLNEQRVKQIMLNTGHAKIPGELADLVIERQVQKVITRQKFS